jgi:hypothetical protein
MAPARRRAGGWEGVLIVVQLVDQVLRTGHHAGLLCAERIEAPMSSEPAGVLAFD